MSDEELTELLESTAPDISDPVNEPVDVGERVDGVPYAWFLIGEQGSDPRWEHAPRALATQWRFTLELRCDQLTGSAGVECHVVDDLALLQVTADEYPWRTSLERGAPFGDLLVRGLEVAGDGVEPEHACPVCDDERFEPEDPAGAFRIFVSRTEEVSNDAVAALLNHAWRPCSQHRDTPYLCADEWWLRGARSWRVAKATPSRSEDHQLHDGGSSRAHPRGVPHSMPYSTPKIAEARRHLNGLRWSDVFTRDSTMPQGVYRPAQPYGRLLDSVAEELPVPSRVGAMVWIYSFLDGGYAMSNWWDGWEQSHTLRRVTGTMSLRLLCAVLGLPQPHRLATEERRQTEEAVLEQFADDLERREEALTTRAEAMFAEVTRTRDATAEAAAERPPFWE